MVSAILINTVTAAQSVWEAAHDARPLEFQSQECVARLGDAPSIMIPSLKLAQSFVTLSFCLQSSFLLLPL